ncbi:MAG: HDOD domain protein [Candidatus Accumulibacter adjunctus]|uniref:HDOD domain protein n=1 Tax=Candidatus Accumulibacter adjunctus TaxID=1454001 RepID=A0A011NPW6_9PROT|nr:MAG: HDOD domain protein [Candidatus Accumulibacter adjunctus]
MTEVFISRQPLVNRQSRIIATRLLLHLTADDGMPAAVMALDSLASVWPMGGKPLFVSCPEATIDARLLDWSAPENATIELPATCLLGEHGPDLIAAIQTWQPTICLHFDPQAARALSLGLQCRFIGFDTECLNSAQLKLLAARTRSQGMGIAFKVPTTADFRASMDAGMTAAAGWFFTTPSGVPAKTLSASQANIMRLVNLVRNNAEMREIEAALKQDVAISYRLLRYINSAGFGLSCEIQSFRHAVTMLGYDKLNRWLSLLLATASKDPLAPALMHTSLVRARLIELLATGLVDKSEYDNLFITGAFSLLDALLGLTMDQILEAMRLPEPITDALLGKGGRYQAFLDLALASEAGDGPAIAEQAGMLGLTATQFNSAQLQALAFADAMEF